MFGNTFVVNYQLSTGRLETVNIDVPPGARHGDTIQYEGLGDEGNRNYPRGNLLIRIKLQKDRNWARDGNDLFTKKSVNLFDFLTGGVIIINTLDDRSVKLNIPQGTKPGTTFSITGYGLPDLKTNRKGNVFVKLEAHMPKIKDIALLKEIEELKKKIG
jgi:DnaJ-class molecular chaperone